MLNILGTSDHPLSKQTHQKPFSPSQHDSVDKASNQALHTPSITDFSLTPVYNLQIYYRSLMLKHLAKILFFPNTQQIPLYQENPNPLVYIEQNFTM